MLQEGFKVISRNIEGCFDGVLSRIPLSFKWDSMVFKRSSMVVWRKFQRCFNGASRVSQRNTKGFSKKFPGSFKAVLRKFQRVFKISVKSVSRKLKKKKVARVFHQWSFVFQFCCSMDLIAATRAEGGLVIIEKSFSCQTQLLLCYVELSCGWVGAVTILYCLKRSL